MNSVGWDSAGTEIYGLAGLSMNNKPMIPMGVWVDVSIFNLVFLSEVSYGGKELFIQALPSLARRFSYY
jgi:hypothetical protein